MSRAVRRSVGFGVVACVCLWAAAALASAPATSQPTAWAAPPDEAAIQAAEEIFQSLYAKALSRVAATSDRTDDVALAGELLSAARIALAQPALVALLCERACDLGERSPEGYPTALAAMGLLADLTRNLPAKADACWNRILAIRTRQLSAASGPDRLAAGQAVIEALLALVGSQVRQGDSREALALARRAHAVAETVRSPAQEEIAAGVRYLLARDKVEAELKTLKAALAADPANQKARDRLIDLYVMELDDPAAAATLLNAGCRQAAQTYVPLAVKGPDQLPAEVCLELGDWCRDLADKAGPCGKGRMFLRARTCYQRYLAEHDKQDVSRLRAVLALKRTDEALKKTPPPPAAFRGAAVLPPPVAPPPAEPPWRDLFNGKDLTAWTGDTASFRLRGDTIIGGSINARMSRSAFLFAPEVFDDFELTAKVRLVGAGANGGVMFRTRHHDEQVNGYQADMDLGQARTSWGLLRHEGRSNTVIAQADPGLVAKALRPTGWNDYRIRCEGPRVRIWLNDVLTVDYTEADSSMSPRGLIGLQIRHGPPSEAAYREIRIRPLK